MINKKRQELLINNLKSISSEVRIMSLQQLMQIPTITVEEKRAFIQDALQDSEEDVRINARKLLKILEGANPDNSGSSTPVSVPPTQPATSASSESVEQGMSLPPLQPTVPPAEDSHAQKSPNSQMPGHVNLSPASHGSYSTAAGITKTGFSEETTSGQASAMTLPPIDEPVDGSLADLKKINDIPTLLQNIKMLAEKKPSGYLALLLQLAESVQEEVALSALQALLNLRDRRVPPHILFKLSNENYSSQRRFLMLKLIMDTEIALDTSLLEKILINEKDVIVKSGLVKVFARNSKEKGLNTIIACLQDPDPRVRANTVEVIEEQGIKGCEQHIVQLLQDPENRVKVNAAKFLVKNGYQQAFLTLRSMLVSPEVWLRDSVIFALGEIGDQASLTLLKAALKDPNQGIRLSVLKSLAKINNATARQVLKAASGDPDPIVAQVANSLWEKVKDTPLREVKVLPAQPVVPQQPVPTAQPVASPQPAQPVVPQQPVPSAQPVASPQPAQPVVPQQPVPTVQPVAPSQPAQPVVPQQPVPTAQPVAPSQPAQPVVPQQPVPTAQPVASPQPAQPVVPQQPVPPVQPVASPQPAQPVASVAQQRPETHSQATVSLPPGSPVFAKPRSAEVYSRLLSDKIEDWRIAARDMAFVMGDDQMIIVKKAYNHSDENVRLSAAKILSRKRTPEAKALLQQMAQDPNELIRSLVEKALQILK
ncbi:MAG: hypothetical protein Kow0029_27020 [Candidatus Rifleibacteriota bacterium]